MPDDKSELNAHVPEENLGSEPPSGFWQEKKPEASPTNATETSLTDAAPENLPESAEANEASKEIDEANSALEKFRQVYQEVQEPLENLRKFAESLESNIKKAEEETAAKKKTLQEARTAIANIENELAKTATKKNPPPSQEYTNRAE